MDGFPKTRNNWEAMIDKKFLPDSVICLDDHQAPENYLFSRFTKLYSLSGKTSEAMMRNEPEQKVIFLVSFIILN